MAKSTKIIAIILSLLVAAVCVTAGISSVQNKDDTTTLPTAGSSTKPTVSVTETTTKPQKNLSELILGKWTDSADISGFEFNWFMLTTLIILVAAYITMPSLYALALYWHGST